jgi:hypothetical protein
VVRQIYATGCWDSDGDPTAAFPLLEETFEFRNPEFAVVPGVRRGHEGFVAATRSPLDGFKRFRLRPVDLEPVGEDCVIARCEFTARGRMSHVDVQHAEWHVWTVRDGRASRVTWYRTRDEAFADAAAGA